MKLLRSRAFLQLAPHEDIQLFIASTTSVMLATATEIARVLGYPPGLEFEEINARAHETAQRALNSDSADRTTWALLSVSALIDGAQHLQTLKSTMQLQLRDAIDSAQYAYGLLVSELDLSAELPEVYFDGLARIACSREHSMSERRAFAAGAEEAFVSTVAESVAELLLAKRPIEIEGFEYDWLGLDDQGFCALFTTAGGGVAPREYLLDTEAHHQAIEELRESGVTTQAVLYPELAPSLENIWREAAQRGLYAYDSDPHGGPYRLVAVPAIPRRVETMPPGVASVSVRCAFRFVNTTMVTEEMLRTNLL